MALLRVTVRTVSSFTLRYTSLYDYITMQPVWQAGLSPSHKEGVQFRPMSGFLIGIFTLVVLTVLLTKTTEDRFHWVKPHLREVWWIVGYGYLAFWIWQPESEQYFMTLKRGFGAYYPRGSYLLVACAGAVLFMAYWWCLGKLLPVQASMNEPPQGEQRKPDVKQSSEGNYSPNTAIIGNNNTVINSDPKTNARLDEITKLLKAQGEHVGKKALLARYPLGYVIFDVDSTDSVFPYRKELLDKWDFDWSVVRITGDPEKIVIRIPDIRRRGASQPFMRDISVGGAKKTGPFAGGMTIVSDGELNMKAEILAIRNDGIVFVIGFSPSRK